MAFNISTQMLPIMDQTAVHRQARFGYIPLFGLFLANLLSQSALGALRLSYDPIPSIKRPFRPSTHHDNYNSWNPDSDTQHIHHHHHIPPANQNQIIHINDRPPEILIIDSDNDSIDQNETTAPSILTEEFPPLPMLRSNLESPNIDEPIAAESRAISPQILAFLTNATTSSTKKVKRGTSKYTKTRKNNKYISQKKRRPTSTTPDYYYDSYEEEEDITTTRRYQPKRKNPYQQRKPIIDSYEDNESGISNNYSDLGNESQEYEYESYEFTTKPHKKRRRTTTTASSTHKPRRYKNKYKVRKPLKVTNFYDYKDFEYDTEPSTTTTTTESLKLRHQELLLRQQEQLQRQQEQLLRQQEFLQRQTVQPAQTTIEPTTEPNASTTTTTQATTTIETVFVQGNTTGSDNTGNNTGYGYGPSNGYESISITYSPTGLDTGPSGGGSPVYAPPSSVYTNPSSTYGVPKPSYGVPNPSYNPSPSYGPPSPSYGPPSSSYGPPSSNYGTPSTGSGFSPSVHGYYQVPFSDWYNNDVSRSSIVKKVHDIIGFDNVFH